MFIYEWEKNSVALKLKVLIEASVAMIYWSNGLAVAPTVLLIYYGRAAGFSRYWCLVVRVRWMPRFICGSLALQIVRVDRLGHGYRESD